MKGIVFLFVILVLLGVLVYEFMTDYASQQEAFKNNKK